MEVGAHADLIRTCTHPGFHMKRIQSNCYVNAWVMKAFCMLQGDSVDAETATFSPSILALASPAVDQGVVPSARINNRLHAAFYGLL